MATIIVQVPRAEDRETFEKADFTVKDNGILIVHEQRLERGPVSPLKCYAPGMWLTVEITEV